MQEQQRAAQGWHIQALGALRVATGGDLRPLAREAPRRLLAYLIINHAAPATRERLADALWPDLPAAQARRRLADALYQLRRALGPGALLADDGQPRLNPDLRVDLWEFERLAAGTGADLQAAVDLYTGDLCPEIYDEWAVGPRAAARERMLDALERLAEAAEAAGADATPAYRRLSAEDPLRESAWRGLMRSLGRAGRLVDALECYAQLERLLAVELGLPPAEATRAIAERLRAELEISRRAAADPGRRFARPPFVGRSAERVQLLDRLDAARAGRGGLALVVGEAGIGKTRLAEELAAAAEWRGWQVAWGHAEELGLAPPFAPLAAALAAVLSPPRRQQLARLVPAHSLALADRLARPGDEPAPAEPVGVVRLAHALADTLAGLARIGPLLLILDDVQWASADLWPLLEALRAPLAGAAVLLLLLGRDAELRAIPAAEATIAGWSAAGVAPLRLKGLGRAELDELAAACGVPALDRSSAERLEAACAGNPLVALALLREGLPQSKLPPSLSDLAARRMGLLAAPARQAARAAAVLGVQFDYGLWEAILAADGLPPEQLPPIAGALERAGIIAISGAGYRFAHDTLRAAIYADTPPRARRAWHRRALAALRARTPAAHPALLHHAEAAGDRQAIAEHAQAAGEQALAAHSYAAAHQAFERARAARPRSDLAGRYAAARGLVLALEVLSDREAQTRSADELVALAEALADDGRRAEATLHRASLAWTTGRFAEAAELALAGLDAARRAGDRRLQALLLEIAGRCSRDLGDYEAAEGHFLAARALYEALSDQSGAAWIDGMLGIVAQRRGQLREAIDYQNRAMHAFRDSGDPYREMRAASGLAIALWWAGDYLAAQAIFERTLELSRSVGDGRMQEASLANLGALADILGDYERAVGLKSEALARSRAAANPMGIAVGLCNLGITYFKLGRHDEALAALDEALALDRASGRRQGEAFCLHSRGQVLLALGRGAEARADLAAAFSIRAELGERDQQIATAADLALATLDDDPAAAAAWVDSALEQLGATDRADLREQVHDAAYRVCERRGDSAAAAEHLSKAHSAMIELLATLPAEARERLLKGDPLHRRVAAAMAGRAELRRARLVRIGVPLGRRLGPADYIEVTWTIAAPEDAALADSAGRRRHVLRRLLREAAAQGAAPTDADLAQALGVSRRTILRDMAVIGGAGASLPTRRRLSQ